MIWKSAVCLVGLGTLLLAVQIALAREAKFLVTTSTIVSTSASFTVCYTTAGTVNACTRKRRGIIDEKPVEFDNDEEMLSAINPQPALVLSAESEKLAATEAAARYEEELKQLANVEVGTRDSFNRDPRLFAFVLTTTITSLAYSTTSTTTITFGCTPSTSALSLCG